MTTLLLDVGNTRIKWALWEGKINAEQSVSLSHHDSLSHRELGRLLQIWQNLPTPTHIFGACVAQEGLKQRIETTIKMRWGNAVYSEWLISRAQCSGLSSQYDDPKQLGIDRWLSALAAWKQTQSACLIVNIGTAMTVDAVDHKGHFLGGLIVPSIEAMKDGLLRHAPMLKRHIPVSTEDAPQLPNTEQLLPFPTNTTSAIEAGLWRALSGAIIEQYERLKTHLNTIQPIKVWLSGGSAEELIRLLPMQQTFLVKDLVLQGAVWQAIELHGTNAQKSREENTSDSFLKEEMTIPKSPL